MYKDLAAQIMPVSLGFFLRSHLDVFFIKQNRVGAPKYTHERTVTPRLPKPSTQPLTQPRITCDHNRPETAAHVFKVAPTAPSTACSRPRTSSEPRHGSAAPTALLRPPSF
jgi:hypothetical protein